MNLIHHETPKARKEHQCDECCHPIAPGTVYVRQRSADGGDVWTYKAHADCFDFARELFDADGPPCTLDEYRSEALDHDPPPAVRARLEANG